MSPWTVLGWMAVAILSGYLFIYCVVSVVALIQFLRSR